MRNTKRIITMLLALVMLVSVMGVGTFAANFSDITDEKVSAAVEKLVAGGIITGYEDGTFRPDNQITRAEFAAIVTRLKGVANNSVDVTTGFADLDNDSSRAWARPYVKAAVDLGIINGFEDGTFRAGEPVTYEQAVKMLVCAAGYEVIAQSEYNNIIIANPNATWSAGYIAAANKHGITKGVVTAKITEPALRGVVAVLTSNTTDVPPLKQNEDGSVEKDEAAEDEKTIVEIQGVVTGTYYTGLESGYAGLGPNQLRIKTADGEEDYELSEALVARVNLEDIIGKRVIAFFDKNEYKLTGISESNNKVIKIKEADIARPLTSSAVKYYNEKGKLQTVSIAGYTFIYNGKYVPATHTLIENLDSSFRNGEIEIIESTGGKIVKITSYDVFVVNGYTKSSGKITFKYGKEYNGESYYQFPSDKPEIFYNGTKKEFSSLSLAAYNIINLLESPADAEGNPIARMYVTTKSYSGKVTALLGSGRKVELDEKEMLLTNDYAEFTGEGKAPFNINDNYSRYFLDYTGQIAAIDYDPASADDYKFGYIISADRDGIYLLTEEGEFVSIPLQTKVKFDGETVNDEEVEGLLLAAAEIANAEYNEYVGTVTGVYQPVKYALGNEEKIKLIDTVVENTGGSGDTFAYDEKVGEEEIATTTNNISVNSMIYKVTNATVLYVPEDRDNEAEYEIMTASRAFALKPEIHLEILGSSSGSAVKNAGIILLYGSNPTLKFTGSSPYMVVTGTQTYNDQIQITGYQSAEKTITTLTVNVDKFRNTDSAVSDGLIDYSEVQVGDLIRYLGTEDSVSRIERIYAAGDGVLSLGDGKVFHETTKNHAYFRLGQVIQNDGDGNLYVTTTPGPQQTADGNFFSFTVTSSTPVYTFVDDELTAENDITAVNTGDYVIVVTLTEETRARIVYVLE